MINNGIISGAITDTYSERAVEHAKRFYEEIHNNKSHSDVVRIAENTGYSFEQILQIKIICWQGDTNGTDSSVVLTTPVL